MDKGIDIEITKILIGTITQNLLKRLMEVNIIMLTSIEDEVNGIIDWIILFVSFLHTVIIKIFYTMTYFFYQIKTYSHQYKNGYYVHE